MGEETNKKLVEITFETLDGVLSNFTYGVPLISIIKNLVNIIGDFRNKRLLKRIFYFLNEINVPEKQLVDFLNKSVYGTNNEQKNGELLFEYIDNIDDLRKSVLIGKALNYILKSDNINKREIYFKFVHLIINSYYDDLMAVKRFSNPKTDVLRQDNELEDLLKSGFLISVGITGEQIIGEHGTTIPEFFKLNEFGEILWLVMNEMEFFELVTTNI